MTFDPMRRPPIVTDEDRAWAMADKPAGWDDDALEWSQHVAEQAERFEAHFGTDRKPAQEWSGLWRRAWWPKADPRILHPNAIKCDPIPFACRGQPGFDAGMAVASKTERAMFERFGVVQFKHDDDRCNVVREAQR